MGMPDDRGHVVLAVQLESDVSQKDDFVVTGDFLETALEQLGRLFVVTDKPFLIGADHSLKRVEEALPYGIVASPANRRANRVFRL